MTSFLAFFIAALTEIAACFAVLAWVKEGASAWWLVPAAVGLAAFAYALTYVESPFAGRTYAAYCGVYILVALAWGWVVEGQRPDLWDMGGTALTLVGAWMILMGPR